RRREGVDHWRDPHHVDDAVKHHEQHDQCADDLTGPFLFHHHSVLLADQSNGRKGNRHRSREPAHARVRPRTVAGQRYNRFPSITTCPRGPRLDNSHRTVRRRETMPTITTKDGTQIYY